MSSRSWEDPLLLPLNIWAFLVSGAKGNTFLLMIETNDFSSFKGLL